MCCASCLAWLVLVTSALVTTKGTRLKDKIVKHTYKGRLECPPGPATCTCNCKKSKAPQGASLLMQPPLPGGPAPPPIWPVAPPEPPPPPPPPPPAPKAPPPPPPPPPASLVALPDMPDVNPEDLPTLGPPPQTTPLPPPFRIPVAPKLLPCNLTAAMENPNLLLLPCNLTAAPPGMLMATPMPGATAGTPLHVPEHRPWPFPAMPDHMLPNTLTTPAPMQARVSSVVDRLVGTMLNNVPGGMMGMLAAAPGMAAAPGPAGAYPGAMLPGAFPGAMPGAYPGAMPGAFPGAMPGAFPGAMPAAYPGAAALPGAYPALLQEKEGNTQASKSSRNLRASASFLQRQEVPPPEMTCDCEE